MTFALAGYRRNRRPEWNAPRPVNGSAAIAEVRRDPAADQRQAARHDALVELARGQQAFEGNELLLDGPSICSAERIEHGREFRHLHRAAGGLLAPSGPPAGRRLVEIEFAAIETGEVGEAAAERIEADQLRVQRADARGDRVDLAVELPAGGLQVGLLLRHGTRKSPLLRLAAEQEPSQHQARDEDRCQHEQRRAAAQGERARPRQVDLSNPAGPC